MMQTQTEMKSISPKISGNNKRLFTVASITRSKSPQIIDSTPNFGSLQSSKFIKKTQFKGKIERKLLIKVEKKSNLSSIKFEQQF